MVAGVLLVVSFAVTLAGAVLLTAFCYLWHRGLRRQPWPRRWL